MNVIYRKSLVATAVAALVTAPAWAATDVQESPGSDPQAQTAQPPVERPMDAPPAVTPPETGSTAPQAAAPEMSSPLYSMTPDDLAGMKVLGPDGEKVGDIKAVVRSRQEQNIQAVISSGGFLGIGDKEVTVPLDKLQYVDGKLHIGATKDELKASTPYAKEQYVELEPKDQPISEFSAFEAVPGEHPEAGRSAAPAESPETGRGMAPGDQPVEEGAPGRQGSEPMTR